MIFSGHDTELGALGGILNAHWDTRNGNIVPDDMPPGSALVFDLMPPGSDKSYSVRLRFASMARERFRTQHPLNMMNWLNDGISFYPVTFGTCLYCGDKSLNEFETIALGGVNKDGKEIVAYEWNVSSEPLDLDPGSSHGVHDPAWTRCDGP